MAKLNQNYTKVPEGYFTSQIIKKTKEFTDSHPGVEILKLGIGNTTEPLAPAVIKGLETGVDKLSKAKTYTGYGDEQGDSRLRATIASWYKKRGINLDPQEILVSDGVKADSANIGSIFAGDSIVAVTDPVYPVYADSNIISGRKVLYLQATEESNFIPGLPENKVDLIYICSPNNPTGVVMTKKELKKFVDYARKIKAVIIFDAAYSEFIRDRSLPKSIYEIEGAKSCSIEMQSLSKSAGFTGVRLGWTVVPMELVTEESTPGMVNKYWNRRQTTMFNGASNIVQEGALAVLGEEGQKQTHEQIKFYMENAKIIKEGLEDLGLKIFGGENAPYIWVKCPKALSSWSFFDKLLEEAHVVCTPGSAFGNMGEGYIRLSAFGHRENIEKAVKSIINNLKLKA